MNKYNTSIIYIIKCLDKNIKDFYIGSTTDFKKRKQNHHHNCYNENSKKFNYKLYKFIRENGGWINFEMKEIINTTCNNKEELRELEGQYIKKYDAKLNCCIAGRKQKEYIKDEKDKILERKKKYYEKNRKEMLIKFKNYRINNKEKLHNYYNEKIKCECGLFFTKSNKARHYRSKKHINIINNI